MRKFSLVASLLAASVFSAPASAAVLYTFNYDAWGDYEAVSISFIAEDIISWPENLTYHSGSVNGCAPSALGVVRSFSGGPDGFGTASACGDGLGPFVDGLAFYTSSAVLALGTYVTEYAGRGIRETEIATSYYYTTGSLVVSEYTPEVPVSEPAMAALFGLGIAALGLKRRRAQA